MKGRRPIAAAGVGVGVLLLLWVSSVRPVRILGEPRDPFDLPKARPLPPPPPAPSGKGSAPPQRTIDFTTGSEAPYWFGLLIKVLVVLLIAVVVLALLRYVQALLRARAERARDTDFDVLPQGPAAVVDDAEAQFAALGTGAPRNAIVACWLRLEDAVAEAGMPRRPSETSAELTARVLRHWSVDADVIADLADLYREARFSRHEMTEPSRTAAVEALRRLHADLRRAQLVVKDAP